MVGIRRLANIIVSKMIQVLYFGPNLTDPGSTFRLISRRIYEKIKNKFTVGGINFQPELQILALTNGFKVTEVPVRYGRRVGESKMSGPFWGGFKIGLVMVKIILSMRIKTFLNNNNLL
ncbi:MAG: hypothetical protein AAB685_00830 [Patescibacteria group bacterium]